MMLLTSALTNKMALMNVILMEMKSRGHYSLQWMQHVKKTILRFLILCGSIIKIDLYQRAKKNGEVSKSQEMVATLKNMN